MVASVFGSKSREIIVQPAAAKAEPTEPVPEKSSSKRIYTCKLEKHLINIKLKYLSKVSLYFNKPKYAHGPQHLKKTLDFENSV